jgi:hypothetical protein
LGLQKAGITPENCYSFFMIFGPKKSGGGLSKVLGISNGTSKKSNTSRKVTMPFFRTSPSYVR